MKLTNLALMAFSLASSAAFSMTPAFQVDYVNYAWGYDNHGCLVDQDRFVYKYAYGNSSNDKGIENVGRLSQADFKSAMELANKASAGKYSHRVIGADGGTTLWTANIRYAREVKLQALGDTSGTNSAPEAKQLADLIDGWCK